MLLSLTLLGLLLIMWLALSVETTTFWTANNISNLLRQGAMIAILAIGETFAIITGGIDLSVGAIAGFVSMMVALLLTNDLGIASSIAGAVAISLAIGIFIGVFHAFGIVQMGLPPFIMTLATMYALRGIGLLITNGATISITNDAFTGFSRASFLGFPWTDGSWFAIPMLFWMVIVVAVPAYVLLNHSRWGRYLFAIGSNKEAARLSGVNVKAVTYLAYVISGFLRRLCRHSARHAHRHRQSDPRRGLGIAGDRLVGHRRHQPFRRGRLGAGAVDRLLHPDDDQQRRKPSQPQSVLAAHHHRRAYHHRCLFRYPPAPEELSAA